MKKRSIDPCLRILLLGFFLGLLISTPASAGLIFIAADGDDHSSGASPDSAVATIGRGFELAQPGDTLFLLPGVYHSPNHIADRNGLPDRPITLMSHADDPAQFAVIDRQALPSSDSDQVGLTLQDCSWVVIENIVFRNCWTNVINIFQSSYITIRSCHFTTGKRVIFPRGERSHHILVENCYIRHPEAVWQGWSWESLHHGKVSYYNGGLLHPWESGGGHVMRGCTIINLFNAFRTRPQTIKQDGNTEIYNNALINIRDNEFEPEGWAWNLHYYHNRHINVHKMFSIDHVQGGNIYIYGNTYTQTTDPWAIEEVSGIFKYKGGPLTYPCYAFNNSYYTEAKVLKEGEASNHLLKHFNNAYYFIEGRERFRVSDWQPGYEFDYDCINQDWPDVIYQNAQEQHGLKWADAGFRDAKNGDFRLRAKSPCIDAGKPMRFPEFQWEQAFKGKAPDIGAYEGQSLVQGPPFRFLPSPAGAYYEERPRISRHLIEEDRLVLYFSFPLDTTRISRHSIAVYQGGSPVVIDQISFPNHAWEMVIHTAEGLSGGQVSVLFTQKPRGTNGLPVCEWASTIPIGKTAKAIPDLSKIEYSHWPAIEIPDFTTATLVLDPPILADSSRIIISSRDTLPEEFINHISIYTADGDEIDSIYEGKFRDNQAYFTIDRNFGLAPGSYIARTRVGKRIISTMFRVIK